MLSLPHPKLDSLMDHVCALQAINGSKDTFNLTQAPSNLREANQGNLEGFLQPTQEPSNDPGRHEGAARSHAGQQQQPMTAHRQQSKQSSLQSFFRGGG